MMRQILFIISAVAMLAAGSCSRKTAVSIAYSYTPELIGMELDGSLTMRVWGVGRNRSDAIEQAHKDAVHTVIFKGLSANGIQPSLTRALVLEPNGQDKYRSYFNAFFTDGGPYTQFVNKNDTRVGSNIGQRSKTQVKYGVTVRVLRSELEQYLIREGILKP